MTVDELVTLTRFADFYRALPKISRSISSALHASPGVEWWMASNPVEVISAAVTLRHEQLFKDGFIYYRNLPVAEPLYVYTRKATTTEAQKLEDPALLKLDGLCSKRLNQQISKVHKALFEDSNEFYCQDEYDNPMQVEFMEKVWIEMSRAARKRKTPASMYREADNRIHSLDFDDPNDFNYDFLTLKREMSVLLANDLHFNRTRVSGEGDCLDGFLCNFIEYKDLPWDQKQTTW